MKVARGARTLADEIPKLTSIRVRDVRLGHAQRGGDASHIDRVLASEMARSAYNALRAKLQTESSLYDKAKSKSMKEICRALQ